MQVEVLETIMTRNEKEKNEQRVVGIWILQRNGGQAVYVPK